MKQKTLEKVGGKPEARIYLTQERKTPLDALKFAASKNAKLASFKDVAEMIRFNSHFLGERIRGLVSPVNKSSIGAKDYLFWTGTIAGYEEPGQPFGKEIIFSGADGSVWVFPVPKKFRGERNAALLTGPRSYSLAVNGTTIIINPKKIAMCRDFPIDRTSKPVQLISDHFGGSELEISRILRAKVGLLACGYKESKEGTWWSVYYYGFCDLSLGNDLALPSFIEGGEHGNTAKLAVVPDRNLSLYIASK